MLEPSDLFEFCIFNTVIGIYNGSGYFLSDLAGEGCKDIFGIYFYDFLGLEISIFSCKNSFYFYSACYFEDTSFIFSIYINKVLIFL